MYLTCFAAKVAPIIFGGPYQRISGIGSTVAENGLLRYALKIDAKPSGYRKMRPSESKVNVAAALTLLERSSRGRESMRRRRFQVLGKHYSTRNPMRGR